ncbi:MAG: bile acid:sodium symporter family protein [Bacteroidales bacterium]|nr:bile acid:sodium symporter family protein [Bacteroidales bacterium]MCB8999689.1 bile acid:sodium symporter family protein [Bacteroidales bacterium]
MSDNFFSDILLPATLGIITLGMGLAIEVRDLTGLFRHPRSIITGLLSQMLILPLLAFMITYFMNIDPVYKVGLIIIAACPGGATSNLVNFMLNGNVALSLSITVINSLLTLLTIPLIVIAGLSVFLGEHTRFHLPYGQTILNIFLIVAIPAAIGISLRYFFTRFAIRFEKPLRYVLPVLLFAVYSGVLFIDKGAESLHIRDYINLYPAAILLNLLSMFAGWYIAKKAGLKRRNQFTIAVEVGLQNSTLAIFIAATLLSSQKMAVVPIIYGSFSFFTTWGIGYLLKRFSR